jgi:hypothetical protein
VIRERVLLLVVERLLQVVCQNHLASLPLQVSEYLEHLYQEYQSFFLLHQQVSQRVHRYTASLCVQSRCSAHCQHMLLQTVTVPVLQVRTVLFQSLIPPVRHSTSTVDKVNLFSWRLSVLLAKVQQQRRLSHTLLPVNLHYRIVQHWFLE